MQSYYRKRAPIYDSTMGYNDHDTVSSLEAPIKRIKELLQSKRVLEIACGPCFWTQQVSQVAESVFATDYNEATLDQARRKNMDWSKIRLQRADAYDLSTVQGDFDAVLAVDWFCHVPKSRFHQFLRGLHERLQAGAQVVLCDQLPGSESISGLYDSEGNHMQLRELPDGSNCYVIKHFLSDTEMMAIFGCYSGQVEISRFPECRRTVVSYILGNIAG